MSKYAVTGGCGFIGSHLVDRLVGEGHDVTVLDDLSTGKRENLNPAASLIVGDICDPQAVAEAMNGAEACFHLAAIASVQKSNEEWVATHKVNLTGTIEIFERARHIGARVVYASSAAVYGEPEAVPQVETARPRPLTAYGADKLGCEQHAKVAGLVHDVRTTGFRFFNVYGPRQDPKSPYSGVISIFVDRLKAGQGISVYGDGLQSRDFIFVGDVVSHLVAGLESASTDAPVFNVCTGRETTILELAQTLGDVLGLEPEISHGPARAGDIRRSLGNPEAAIAALSVRADVLLADGLRQTLEHVPQP